MKRILIYGIVLIIVIGGYYLNSRLLSSGRSYRPGSSTLAKLRDGRVREVNGRYYLGKASKEVRSGTTVLYLYGTPYELGYQQGALMKDEIARGTVPVFADPVSHSRSYADKPGIVKWFMLKFLEFKVYGPIERSTPDDYLQEISGIADGAGISYRDAFRASFLSDVTMNMLPGVITKRAASLGLDMECSDFAVSGSASKNGTLIVGRNTDYGGQGRWMKYQTVCYYHPDEGLDYVKVSTAGLLKCNSAMNEKGITVGGHFMGLEGARPGGLSFTVLENEIMRRAGTLDEALGIVKSSRRSGSFALMISDGKDGRAAVVEAAGDSIGIRGMENGSIVLTNFATTGEMKEHDLMARYNLVMRDLRGRYRRLEELIKANRGKIDPGVAARFLGDHVDVITGTERGTGITVCASNNVTSAVFLPARGMFWVAAGSEPACGNSFIPFTFAGDAVNGNTLRGYRWENSKRKEALARYMGAFSLYVNHRDRDEEVIEKLRDAIALDPSEPIYRLMLGRMLIFKMDYTGALKELERGLPLPQSNNEKAVFLLFRGFLLDIMNKRDEAVTMYRTIADMRGRHGSEHFTGINDMVAGFANRHISEPVTEKEVHKLPFSFNNECGIE